MHSIQGIQNSFQIQPHRLSQSSYVQSGQQPSSIQSTENVDLSPKNILHALERDLKEQMHSFIKQYPEFKIAYPQSASITLKENRDFALQIGPYPTPALQPDFQREATKVVHEQISNFVDKNYATFQYLADGNNHIRLQL